LAICEVCKTVLIYGDDGVIGSRPATEEERAAVPAPVVWSEEERAWWRENLRQARVDLGDWLQSGCPGLTKELEASLPPGTMERLKQFVDQGGNFEGIIPDDKADPGRSTET
jgi:hypothetical protein